MTTKYTDNIPVSEVMVAACAAHRINGFVKKHEARPYEDPPIKSNKGMIYDHFYYDMPLDITEDDQHQAAEMVEYLKGFALTALARDLSQFERNVLNLVTATTTDSFSFGIAASLPKVYLSNLDRDAWEMRERELAATSDYVGTVRTRSNFDMVIENVRYISSRYITLYTCTVDGKDVVKFFSDLNWGKEGDRIQVTGYIKSHAVSAYSGGKETMINRIKEISQ